MIRRGLIWSVVALALMVGMSLWTYGQLPDGEMIPTHWNAAGEADSFSSKRGALMTMLMMPAIMAFTCGVLAIAPLLDPKRGNLIRSSKAYMAVWMGTLVLMVCVMAGVCYSIYQGTHQGDGFNSEIMVRLIIAGCALLFVVIGNYLPKTRPTWFLGIRTPWTLSSDITWEKTHRFGGRLFMLSGVLGLIGAFTFNGLWLALQLSTLAIGAALIASVYSYFVWRTAADRPSRTDFVA